MRKKESVVNNKGHNIVLKIFSNYPNVVVYAFNPSTQGMEEGNMVHTFLSR